MYLVSRTETFAKLFFIISFVGLFMYIFLAFYTFHNAYFSKSQTKKVQKRIQSFPDLYNIAPLKQVEYQSTKYILLWRTNGSTENPIGEGQEPFIRYNCLHQNCYITTDKELIGDYTDFHAIVFNGSDLRRWNKTQLPLRRSLAQKYVFFSKLSSEDVPICNPQADNFFNWTWSYKLYSDIVSPFFEVRDLKGDKVAPNYNVVWAKYEYEELDLMKLNKTKKSKAVASVWDKCHSYKGLQMSKILARLKPVDNNLIFDVFGCDNKTCDRKCLRNIEEKYFFYFVNDGVIAEDYVTDALLTAIETNTVPILVGVSDYTRFLPPGSYLSSSPYSIEELGFPILYATENLQTYFRYFHWKKFYTFHRTPHFQGLCQLCSNLNNPSLMERRTHYQMFRRWWFSGPLTHKCLKRKQDPQKRVPEPEWRVSYYKRNMSSTRWKPEDFTKGKGKDFDLVM